MKLVIPLGSQELRVIEDVKELRPELQIHAFRNPVSFSSAKSQLLNPGP